MVHVCMHAIRCPALCKRVCETISPELTKRVVPEQLPSSVPVLRGGEAVSTALAGSRSFFLASCLLFCERWAVLTRTARVADRQPGKDLEEARQDPRHPVERVITGRCKGNRLPLTSCDRPSEGVRVGAGVCYEILSLVTAGFLLD
eukprot:3069045-Rhodomonas_salina.5